MDVIFLLVLPGALWIQSWYLLGFFANPRTLGLISAGVALVLLTTVLFQDKVPMTPVYPAAAEGFLTVGAAMSVFMLLWTVYTALIAGVYLWGMDSRTLGFYSLFLWVTSTLFAVYFFVGGEVLGSGDVADVSWLLGTVAVLLAVLAGLMFFYLGLRPPGQAEPPSSGMRTVTGWFYLVFSVAITILGGVLLLGLDPTL